MYISPEVKAFLVAEARSNKRHVHKLQQILTKLAEYGLQHMGNIEQFRHEGKFQSGSTEKEKIAVYAVKAFQLRLYGGFVQRNGKSYFVCVGFAKKKKDRADQDQLKRVSSAIGELQ